MASCVISLAPAAVYEVRKGRARGGRGVIRKGRQKTSKLLSLKFLTFRPGSAELFLELGDPSSRGTTEQDVSRGVSEAREDGGLRGSGS